MSLDTFFKQILQNEQEQSEKTKKLQGVKVTIIRYHEKIKASTEKYEKANQELDEKSQQLSQMKLQHDLTRKCEDQMEKQMQELLCQQKHLEEHQYKLATESKQEQEKFMRDIQTFNSDFSLHGHRETAFESQTHSEVLDLEKEVDSLYREMELMSQSNSYMNTIEEEKRALQLELQGLENIKKDLYSQLREAEAMTESLRMESVMVSQKHLTDSTCLRVKRELEIHKDGELELLREALRSEIQFLKAKLDSQKRL